MVRLPQWTDYQVAEAAGFHIIGDGGTGHEHFIQWDWINDDVILDPDSPEALVYEPQPDGSKKLVSAMYMLPERRGARGRARHRRRADAVAHPRQPLLHQGPDAPRGRRASRRRTATCPADLQKFPPAAMIHVWITPHPCGPFAALEGVGAGTIVEGEERLCDHVHGGH